MFHARRKKMLYSHHYYLMGPSGGPDKNKWNHFGFTYNFTYNKKNSWIESRPRWVPKYLHKYENTMVELY